MVFLGAQTDEAYTIPHHNHVQIDSNYSSSSLADEQLVDTANGQAKMRINMYEHKGLSKKLVTGTYTKNFCEEINHFILRCNVHPSVRQFVGHAFVAPPATRVCIFGHVLVIVGQSTRQACLHAHKHKTTEPVSSFFSFLVFCKLPSLTQQLISFFFFQLIAPQ